MSEMLTNDQELVSDLVACQLVIKQILDVIDIIGLPKCVIKCRINSILSISQHIQRGQIQ